jgi:predicted phosphoadenosine phosphosulfate sulfurtransferase
MASSENNLDKARNRTQLLLRTVQVSFKAMWSSSSIIVQENFLKFSKQDWRDFAQTLLESMYPEYEALDRYYLPPIEVHILQDELDNFAETFPRWFKENFG